MYNMERTRKLKMVIAGLVIAWVAYSVLMGEHIGAMIFALKDTIPLIVLYIVIEVMQRDVEAALQSLYKNKQDVEDKK